jgi:hypothetical protein
MTEADERAEREAEAAAAEAGAIGGETGDPVEHPPAERAPREAGQGEAEGFEEAEESLIEHAQHTDLGHSPRHDAFTPEAEADRSGAEYAEADHEPTSEREDQQP